MSKQNAEGSIPSGRAPESAQENQVVAPNVTGRVSSDWSRVGPKAPELGACEMPRPGESVLAMRADVEGWHLATVSDAYPPTGVMEDGLEVPLTPSGYGSLWKRPDESQVSQVIPEPRRCKGAPGCTCDAVLGPRLEVPGDLCAHCENLARELARQTEETEEAFVDCDGCLPDRMPKSGRLCGRCAAAEERSTRRVDAVCREVSRGACASLRTLVRVGYFTADEAQGVQSALDVVLRVAAAELAVMSLAQEVVMAGLLKDAVSAISAERCEPARGELQKAVRS